MKYGSVLGVDDDPDILQAARLLLKQHVAQVDTEQDPNRLPTLLKRSTYDVILLDMNFSRGNSSGREGFYWLEQIINMDPTSTVVMITALGMWKRRFTASRKAAVYIETVAERAIGDHRDDAIKLGTSKRETAASAPRNDI